MKSTSRQDAVALLMQDHKDVDALFKQYEKLCKQEADATAREELAQQICAVLTVHATIEEEIFYPAVRRAIEDQDLLDEAVVEHASAKDLIAQIMGSDADEALYDAKVTVLGEYIRHHVKEEEGELFPLARKSSLDLRGLGTQLEERRDEMLGELGLAGPKQSA